MAEVAQNVTSEQESASEQRLEQRVTELQISPQQANELQILEESDRDAASAENGRGHHHDARSLLHIDTIYMEPQVEEYTRGREILAHLPNANRIEITSHWKIPELHGNADLVQDWVKVKRNVLVLGVKKSLSGVIQENESCIILQQA